MRIWRVDRPKPGLRANNVRAMRAWRVIALDRDADRLAGGRGGAWRAGVARPWTGAPTYCSWPALDHG